MGVVRACDLAAMFAGGDMARQEKAPVAGDKCDELDPRDHRFRQIVGEAAWRDLPEPVRRRFSKQAKPGDVTLYRGRVVETTLSPSGRILAWLATLIGAPLPATQGATGPATVTVIEDPALGGQSWTRVFPRPGGFPQVVHSAKRFQGPTGLEEYVGAGIGMTLVLAVERGALLFRSDRYFIELGGVRLLIPRAFEPGRMEIIHT